MSACLPSLAAVMGGARLARVALLFAVATYFHFLVGLFWFFAAMALRLVGDRRDLRAVMAATGMFLLLVAPLLGTIVWTRLAADSTVAEAGRPSAVSSTPSSARRITPRLSSTPPGLPQNGCWAISWPQACSSAAP